MEVHAHTHTERKKWTHYFWEFLMLFLAVFCGFLAENQREHIVEHKREHKYLQNLFEDLKRDTAAVNSNIDLRITKSNWTDSLIKEFDQPEISRDLKNLCFHILALTNLRIFSYSNSTITQMKNSGLLRLIRNNKLADQIVQYDLFVEKYLVREDVEREIISHYRNAISVVLPSDVILSMQDSSGIGFKMPVLIKPLLTNDPYRINLLKGLAANLQIRNNINLYYVKLIKSRAISLMEAIKKEYHLK